MRANGDDLVMMDVGRVDYTDAWQRQRDLAAARRAGTGPDTVLLLEHPAVYTAGKRTQPEDRPTDGTPVIDVDRGGRITWHGPGQLVGYPIIKLADPIDVVAYVRMLEQVLITGCRDLGLATGRVPGRSGVWLPADETRPERKIAAIGVRIAGGVTMHGFALNCNPDLTAFDRIVPCGISDAGTTSLSAELDRDVTIDEARPLVSRHLADGLNGRLPSDATLPAPEPAAPVPALARATTAGIAWHLDPALR